MKRITVRLSDEDHNNLVQLLKQFDLTIQETVEKLIQELIQNTLDSLKVDNNGHK